MHLKRTLNQRQISMIAIGGSIGTGLFLASGSVIHSAGPGGALLAYGIMGIMVYFLMTSLGEMAAFMPTSGSFYTYAARFVDPALGFALGCNYWFNWAITIAAEIAAATLVMQFWFPHSSPAIWSGLFLSIMVGLNIFSARGFGEAEYWMSFIKVSVIVAFILIGAGLVFGFGSEESIGFKNWSLGDAPFHGGFFATLSAFMVVGFSFQGTELIGVAAGESENPTKTIPAAIKKVFWRILLFYVLVMMIISFLIPYTDEQLTSSDVMQSPFTLVFSHAGLMWVASLMNAVILIAILSAGNSGMYASTRMLWYLAKQGHAPKIFSHINKNGIPMYALIATASIGLFVFLSSLFGSGAVYMWLLNASSLSGFIAWMGIALSHYRFRKAYLKQGHRLEDLPYVAKGYPYAPLLAFALCVFIIAGQNYTAFTADHIDWEGIVVSYMGVPLFLALWLGYKWKKRTQLVHLHHCDLTTES